MDKIELLSKNHFLAYNQVVEDYKSLLVYEQELALYNQEKRKFSHIRIKNEIVILLKRIIENKNFLCISTKADEEYLTFFIQQD
jgi:hypothetical protein